MWTQEDIEDVCKRAYKAYQKELREERNGRPMAITD